MMAETCSFFKFEKLVHLVGSITRIYHDARSHDRQIHYLFCPFPLKLQLFLEISFCNNVLYVQRQNVLFFIYMRPCIVNRI